MAQEHGRGIKREKLNGKTVAEKLAIKSCKLPDAPGCWLWTGAVTRFGHGTIWTGSRFELAHRAAYMVSKGTIPPGACVLHSCDVPSCVNPSHLRLGSKKDNMGDALKRGRIPSGRKHPHAKLNPEIVLLARASVDRTRRGSLASAVRNLAAATGASHAVAEKAISGRSWRWL